MIGRLLDRLCALVCRRGRTPRAPSAVPEEVRQASHRMANAAANIQGMAAQARKKDVMAGLVRLMQDGPQ